MTIVGLPEVDMGVVTGRMDSASSLILGLDTDKVVSQVGRMLDEEDIAAHPNGDGLFDLKSAEAGARRTLQLVGFLVRQQMIDNALRNGDDNGSS